MQTFWPQHAKRGQKLGLKASEAKAEDKILASKKPSLNYDLTFRPIQNNVIGCIAEANILATKPGTSKRKISSCRLLWSGGFYVSDA